MPVKNRIIRVIASLAFGGAITGVSAFFTTLQDGCRIFVPGAILLALLIAGISWEFFSPKESQGLPIA